MKLPEGPKPVGLFVEMSKNVEKNKNPFYF